ncbi:MAG: hypothetical protein HKN92_03560 [Chitinophagales bacterium]|nr:hypothetical protein [Chitinophagales bacterium]
MSNDLEILLYVLRRKRRLALLIYVAIFNASLFGILVGSYNTGFLSDLLVFICACLLTLSLFLVTKWFLNRDLSKHPFVQIVKEKSNDVVWVYWHRTENMPFGVKVFTFNRIFICLNDSSCYHISVQANEVDLITEYCKQVFSRAVFGYSEERDQLFKINPELISKD